MEKSLFRQRLSSNQMSRSWKWGSHSTFPSDLQQIEQIWIWWSWEKWYFFLCYKKEEREQYWFHHKICPWPGSVHSYLGPRWCTWIKLATRIFVGYTKHSSVWNSLNQKSPGGNVKTQKSTPGSGRTCSYVLVPKLKFQVLLGSQNVNCVLPVLGMYERHWEKGM